MTVQSSTKKDMCNNIGEDLRKVGLKATPIRIAILDFLTKNHGPFTTQELFKELKTNKNLKSLDLATVYRYMEKFLSVKLVSEHVFFDGTSRYEIEGSTHHHHIICTSCKRIDPIFYCPVKLKISDKIKKGYTNISHTLEFYGLCPECQRI